MVRFDEVVTPLIIVVVPEIELVVKVFWQMTLLCDNVRLLFV